jgi:hypothetical protein
VYARRCEEITWHVLPLVTYFASCGALFIVSSDCEVCLFVPASRGCRLLLSLNHLLCGNSSLSVSPSLSVRVYRLGCNKSIATP